LVRGPRAQPLPHADRNLQTVTTEGKARKLPWEPGRFLEWLLTDEVPVLIEPLIKFLGPVLHFFNPAAGGWLNRTFLALVILWTLATWGGLRRRHHPQWPPSSWPARTRKSA